MGPVFVIGTGLSQALQAKRLTVLNLLQPIGQVLGGVMMAAAAGMASDSTSASVVLTPTSAWISNASRSSQVSSVMSPSTNPASSRETRSRRRSAG